MDKPSRSTAMSADRLSVRSNIWQVLVKQSGLGRIASFLVAALVDRSDLKVNWRVDRRGNSCLEVFDPLTEKHHYFHSEQEALVWVEQRYGDRVGYFKENSMSTKVQETDLKAIVRRFYEEVFNRRNVDLIDELMTEPFTNHDPTPVAARDRESMKQFIQTLTIAFPDHHHSIEDLIEEDDQVVMRCTFSGTHLGEFPGFLEMPPTHRSFRQRQIHILRVRNGKLAEHQVVRDDLGFMQQLGVIPVPEGL